MKQLHIWKKVALAALVVVTLAPVAIPYVFEVFNAGVSVDLPAQIKGRNSCYSESGAPCRGSLVFRKIELTGDFAFFGVSNTSPQVFCVTAMATRGIAPERWISGIAVYSKAALECPGDLVASLLNRDGSPANAWSVPMLVAGDLAHVSRLAKAMTFYSVDFRPLIAVVALFQLGLTLLFFNTIGRSFRSHRHTFSFVIVAVMAIVNGGLIESVSGLSVFEQMPFLKFFLSNWWFSIFAAEALLSHPTKRAFAHVTVATAIVTALEILLGAPATVFYSILVTAWLLLGLYKRNFFTGVLSLLNVSYLVPVYFPLMILPVFSASFFMMVYIFGYQLEFIRLMLIDWRLTQVASSVHSVRRYWAYLKLASRSFRVGRFSLAITKSDSFTYWRFSNRFQSPKALKPDDKSSVVSKVYATGLEIRDADSRLDPFTKISNHGPRYLSYRYTAVPIIVGGEVSGVLSFTDYEGAVRHPDAREALIQSFTSVAKNVAVVLANTNNDRCSQMEEVARNTLSSDDEVAFHELVGGFLSSIFSGFSVSGYLAKVTENGVIEAIVGSGRFEKSLEVLNGLGFTVNPKNEFGPISLAFRDFKPIVLQNWKPISEKFSVAARRLYVDLETNSIITIPVRKRLGGVELRYLLWLQTDSSSVFTQQYLSFALLIQSKLGQVLDGRVSNLVGETVLALADSDAIHAIVRGDKAGVRESGDLVMIDLGKSTVLSSVLGVESFQKVSRQYSQLLSAELSALGFSLQMVLGDALLFTRARDENVTGSGTLALLEALNKCESELRSLVSQMAPDVYVKNEPALRCCRVFGDISRDLVRGTGGGWTIVGSTISEVHKVEAAAKALRSGIYFELDVDPVAEAVRFVKTDRRPWSGSPTLRYVEWTPKAIQSAA